MNANGNLVAEYTWGLLGPLMRRPSNVNNIRYYIQDGLGHTRAPLDNASNVTDWYVYEAWGGLNNSLSSTPTANPFRWNGAYGYEWIPITGLYHVGAREYDPRVGRWLQRDPVDIEGGDPNLYRYCGNDPLTYVDSDGLIYRDRWGRTNGANSDALANLAAGWGDRLAPFGLTSWIRDLLGVNDMIDPCNPWYLAGHTIGAGHSLALGRGGGGGGLSLAKRGGRGGRQAHSRYGDGTLVYEGQQPSRLPQGPDRAAEGAHTRLRWDTRNNRVYQGREFDANGNPVRDIDFTNPTFPNGRPRPGHPGPPHQHPWTPNDPNNPGAGHKRGAPEPFP